MKRVKTLVRNVWFIFAAGLLLGAVVILAIRFATYKPLSVHYHANFAVYINGQRQKFSGAQYYQEELTACLLSQNISTPQQRAHMHDNINNVVHVHDHAVTWGQFFENLGWNVGPNFIQTDTGALYVANGANQLHILINGQDYTGLTPITNMVIKDKSKLLVSFGDASDTVLQQEYKVIPSTAAQHDAEKDPSSCSGPEKVTVKDRLHHLF